MRRSWPVWLLLLAGCPSPQPAADITLVADPPPTEDGRPPGADATANDRAIAYIKAEAWAEAVTELDKVLAADENNAQAHYYRALALKSLNQLDEAEAGFEKALSLDATLLEARVHMGELLLVKEPPEPERAITMLDPAVKAEPKAKDTRELLAYAHYLLGHWSDSADHYGVLVELDDDKKFRFQLADTLFRAGRLDESVVQMRKLLPLFDKELKIVVQFSHRFGKAKAFEDCVKGFDTAIGLDPGKAALYVHRGVCKHGLKDEKGARLDYVKAIETDDKFQPGYYYLGKSWIHEKRPTRSVEAYKKCIQLDPESKMGKRCQSALDDMKKKG